MSGSGYALAVLFAINLMNFFDRQIIGGVGEGIRREMGLSDTALGLLGTVFTLLYAVVGLPLGRLSDRTQRRKILSAGVFVWSLLTAASGLARSFSQLIVARLGVGVDLVHRRSLSRDHARARRRHLDARPAAGARPRERRRRMDSPELGLAEGLLHRRGAGPVVRRRGVDDARAEARHARTARGRRPLPPGQSVSPRALHSNDVVD